MKSMTRRSLAVVLAILMVFSTMMVGMVTANAASTVYFVNSNSWSTVKAYAWDTTNSNAQTLGAWSGTAMTVHDATNKVYKIDVGAANKVIFNDGGSNQTADLDVEAGKFFEPKTGQWYANATAAIQAAGSAVAYDWYVCGTLNGNNWTLAQANMGMTKQSDGSYVKEFTNVAAGTYEYKVNNGTWSTAYPSSNKSVTVATAGSTVTVKLSGTTVTDTVTAPAATTAATTAATQDTSAATTAATTAAPSDKVTIVYSDVHGWDKVYVHAWSASADLTTWPGTEMTYKETNEYGQKQYTAELDASVVGMVFNNGNGAQDPDAAYVAGAAGYYYDADSNTVKTWGAPEPSTAASTAATQDTSAATDKDNFEAAIAASITKADDDDFGSVASFKGLEMLGIQEKSGANDIRFVTAVSKAVLEDENVIDYGYIVAKSSKTKDEVDNLIGTLSQKEFSCKGTTCAAAGTYGDGSKDYSYVTFGVNNIPADKFVLARFYVKTKYSTTYYYATYDAEKAGIVYSYAA
ncbi:MAG: starch-binding protein [Ruminococcus sp.]|nr:starch-binding protein [Ruminococcus sp.]